MRARSADHALARDAAELGRLKIAQQSFSEEMRRLRAARKQAKATLVGGIPIDSEYLAFVIDTSGSMASRAWDRLRQQITETLTVYPRLKGLQVLNDNGTYMFPERAAQWLSNSAAMRADIIEPLKAWARFSPNNPKHGIYTAINDFYRAPTATSVSMCSVTSSPTTTSARW